MVWSSEGGWDRDLEGWLRQLERKYEQLAKEVGRIERDLLFLVQKRGG